MPTTGCLSFRILAGSSTEATQAEYIANLTNTLCTNLNSPQLRQIQNAILKLKIEANNKQIDNTLKQILLKLNMSTDSNGYPPSSLLHSCEEIKTQYPNSLSDYYTISMVQDTLVMSTVRWDRFVVVVDGLEWSISTLWTQLRSVPVDSDCTIRKWSEGMW